MKKIILLIILLQLIGCREVSKPSEKYIKDSNGKVCIVILNNYHYPPISNKNAWLTDNEVNNTNRILTVAINNMNAKMERDFYRYNFGKDGYKLSDLQVNLNEYKRQYLPYINSNGEKEIWINCLCRPHSERWLQKIYLVDGGGKRYFQGTINLSKNTYHDFMINSPI